MMRKSGSNWVAGDRFFDRANEIEVLEERVREGTHMLLTAQRRMGKTSLIQELLRRLGGTGEFDVVFVDVEAAKDSTEMVTELSAQSKSVLGVLGRIKSIFENVFKGIHNPIEELSVSEVKVKLRAGIDAGNWLQRGNAVFSALARNERPVVLAIDELPILVNRLLKEDSDNITAQGKRETEAFLSWLRKNGQEHRGQITIIVSGSVGLEPILEQAALSAYANIFTPFFLEPWSEEIATLCLEELSKSYGITLPLDVRQHMCSRLRCCIPHHVQIFFDRLHDHLRLQSRREASIDDVELVYLKEMLGNRGKADMKHYEERLKMILGSTDYRIAIEILRHTATRGYLDDSTVRGYKKHFHNGVSSVKYVLQVLYHDGYLEQQEDGTSRFVSGLLEDWWRKHYGQPVVSVNWP